MLIEILYGNVNKKYKNVDLVNIFHITPYYNVTNLVTFLLFQSFGLNQYVNKKSKIEHTLCIYGRWPRLFYD